MEKQHLVKSDVIMKNMLIHALRMLFRQEIAEGTPTKETSDLVVKLADYEGRRLFLTDGEYKKSIQALNLLRDSFISAGRYTDGIDSVLMRILHSRYRRCAVR